MRTTSSGSDEPLIDYDNPDQRDAALLATDAIELALGGRDEVEDALDDGRLRPVDGGGWTGCDITGPDGDRVMIAREDNVIQVTNFTGVARPLWDARFTEKTPARVIAGAILAGLGLD